MKQVNVALTILLTYFPEDLTLDNTASDKELLDAAEADVKNVISDLEEATNLSVHEFEIEVCGN